LGKKGAEGGEGGGGASDFLFGGKTDLGNNSRSCCKLGANSDVYGGKREEHVRGGMRITMGTKGISEKGRFAFKGR